MDGGKTVYISLHVKEDQASTFTCMAGIIPLHLQPCGPNWKEGSYRKFEVDHDKGSYALYLTVWSARAS